MKILLSFLIAFVLMFLVTFWILTGHPPDVPIPERDCFYGCPTP
jgi:hypothetical protein